MNPRYACIFFQEITLSELKAFAEACYRFTPQIAIRETEAVFLEIGKSAGLFNEDYFILKLKALSRRFQKKPRIAIASHPGYALSCARYGVKSVAALPLESLTDLANPFCFDADLQERVSQMIRHWRSLGIDSLSHIQKIPPKSLVARFGKEGLLAARILDPSQSRQSQQAWPQFRIPERIEESLDFLEGIESVEQILFISKHILDRMMSRLWARAKRLTRLQITWQLERNIAARHWDLSFTTPQGSSQSLLPFLRDRFHHDCQRQPLESAVRAICFQVLETAPSQSGGQRHFFNQSEQWQENWGSLIDRLSLKLGQGHAFLACPVDRHLPEKAWRPLQAPLKIQSEHAHTTTPAILPRPTRLLASPLPLKRQGQQLLLYQQNQWIHWTVKQWQGPERIAAEWWEKDSFFEYRDYYQVSTACGRSLWIFALNKTEFFDASVEQESTALFLHGYFD